MPTYLKLEIIRGESKAKGHEGWIELGSLQIGGTREIDQNDTSGDVACTRRVDSTSVLLNRLAIDGKLQPAATIDFVDLQGKMFLQLQLQYVLIASHSTMSRDGQPVEAFTLAYRYMTLVRFSANVPHASATVLQNLLSAPVP